MLALAPPFVLKVTSRPWTWGNRSTAPPFARPKRAVRTQAIQRLGQGERDTRSGSLSASLDVDESWSDESLSSMDTLMSRFKRADLDGNGVIDRTELRGLLQLVDEGDDFVPMSWLTEMDLDRIMEQYDANHDGVIQFSEYIKMAQDEVLLQGKLQEYQEAFREADSDADGKLGAREVFKLFKMLGHPLTYESLVRIFDEYDLDQSGTIEFAEFLRMFRSKLLDLDQILDYVAVLGEPWTPASCLVDTDKAGRLPAGMVSDIQSQADLDAVLYTRQEQLVVLMATLTWCSSSKRFVRDYEALSRHYQGAVFLRLVGNSNPSAKDLFKATLKCRATPTFYFFRNGCLRGKYQGAFPQNLERELRLLLFPDDMPPALFPPEESEGLLGRD